MSDNAPARLKPPGESLPAELAEFVKARTYRASPLFNMDFARARKAELYNQNEQWLQKSFTTADSRMASQWRPMVQDANDPNSLPLPCYNEGVGLLENESARLGRPEYKPRVKPKGESPSITAREAANGAERALFSRLKDMPWDVQADLLFLHLPLYGGAWIESTWDQTWLETVRVPVPSLTCPASQIAPQPAPTGPVEQAAPGSPSVAADPTAPAFSSSPSPPAIQAGPGVLPAEPEGPGPEQPEPDPLGDMAGMANLAAMPCGDFKCKQSEAPADGCCPNCKTPLEPYQPSMEEAAQGPLGQDMPKGDWTVRIVAPYGIFPRDAGIGVDRTDVDEWVKVHVERVDWVAEHYPDKVRDKDGNEIIRGESPAILMAQNPTGGAPSVLMHWQTSGVFKDHVLVYDYNRKPWMEWNEKTKTYGRNQGRAIVLVAQPNMADVVCLDDVLMVQSLNQPKSYVARTRLEFVPWEMMDGGRRSTVGQSLWDRLFDPQDGVNERKSQVRAVNQRGALPFYIQKRVSNLETAAADSAIPFRRVLADVDPGDNRPILDLVNNTTINPDVYHEIEDDRDSMTRLSGAVEVEKGQVPVGVSAATAIAYLKTEAGEKRRPRILRVRQALVRAWEHGLQLMAALYIEPRPYSYEDETGEERWAFIHGDVIASANPKVDIYPTPDYDVTDARRESVRDLINLHVIDPSKNARLNRLVVQALDDTLGDFFQDDALQEQQAQREWQLYKDTGRLPVIDPSLDDAATHWAQHGRDCFSATFRQKEDEGGWDKALSVLQAQWDETLTHLVQALPPGTNMQDAVLSTWGQMLEARGVAINDSLRYVLQWRAHMEAHKLTMVLKALQSAQPSVAAPAQGSGPASPDEGGAAGQPQQMPPQAQPQPAMAQAGGM